jgi:hypothetical protein
MMSAELANESSPLHVRNAAGLALKNALTARVRQQVVFSSLVDIRLIQPGTYLGECKTK